MALAFHLSVNEQMIDKYALQIFWSDEDERFIVVCQEFPVFQLLAKLALKPCARLKSLWI